MEVDVRALWKELDAYEKELDKEAKTLQDIWVKVAQLKTKSEEEAARSAPPLHFTLCSVM